MTSTLDGITTAGWAERARPFVDRGLLAAEDVFVVDRLVSIACSAGSNDTERSGAPAPAVPPADVLLALAFAVRAPREGSAGVDLRTIAARADERSAAPALVFPAPEAWASAVRATTSLVARDTTSAEDASPFVHDGALLAMRRYALYQRDLARALLRQRRRPTVVQTAQSASACERALTRAFGPRPSAKDNQLVDHQRVAAEAALSSGLLLLCGGPGTGKTYTLRRLLVVLRALFLAETGREPLVALAAPTGKAAVRMGELVHADTRAEKAGARDSGEAHADEDEDEAELGFLRSLGPTTLHRLLGLGGGLAPRPRANAEEPLPHDVVIVDEASMIDLAMMARLTAAIRPGARLVLVGDPQQLTSVEAGTVLADAISPEADALARSVVRLVRSRRVAEASRLARLGESLAEGTEASLDAAIGLFSDGATDELQHYPHADSRLSEKTILLALAHHVALIDLLTAPPSTSRDDQTRAALARLDDFRLLTPHRRGRFGVAGLTVTLVDRLARERPDHVMPSAGMPLFVGMPLMVVENRPDLGLVNGDVGLVVRGDGGRLGVAFRGPGRDGAIRVLARAELPAHEPCLAMTVHKSQGSQYRSVLFVLPDEPSPIVTRELVYTAITRAMERVILGGSREVLRRALDRRITRASSLASRIREAALPLSR